MEAIHTGKLEALELYRRSDSGAIVEVVEVIRDRKRANRENGFAYYIRPDGERDSGQLAFDVLKVFEHLIGG